MIIVDFLLGILPYRAFKSCIYIYKDVHHIQCGSSFYLLYYLKAVSVINRFPGEVDQTISILCELY